MSFTDAVTLGTRLIEASGIVVRLAGTVVALVLSPVADVQSVVDALSGVLPPGRG